MLDVGGENSQTILSAKLDERFLIDVVELPHMAGDVRREAESCAMAGDPVTRAKDRGGLGKVIDPQVRDNRIDRFGRQVERRGILVEQRDVSQAEVLDLSTAALQPGLPG